MSNEDDPIIECGWSGHTCEKNVIGYNLGEISFTCSKCNKYIQKPISLLMLKNVLEDYFLLVSKYKETINTANDFKVRDDNLVKANLILQDQIENLRLFILMLKNALEDYFLLTSNYKEIINTANDFKVRDDNLIKANLILQDQIENLRLFILEKLQEKDIERNK